jgi:hypothetical protein
MGLNDKKIGLEVQVADTGIFLERFFLPLGEIIFIISCD